MNGFDPDQVDAERICVVSSAVENKYFSTTDEVPHPWPWYVYGRPFFEGVGAEFREIDKRLQMLLDEVVYEVEEFSPCAIRKLYEVGRRAIRTFDSTPDLGDLGAEYSDPDHLGSIAPFVHELLGRCLVRCQTIEANLARSFIF